MKEAPRIKWHDFALDWIQYMNGPLAMAWTETILTHGNMVSFGDIRIKRHIFTEIESASAAERQVIEEARDAVNDNARKRPALMSAEQLQAITLRKCLTVKKKKMP